MDASVVVVVVVAVVAVVSVEVVPLDIVKSVSCVTVVDVVVAAVTVDGAFTVFVGAIVGATRTFTVDCTVSVAVVTVIDGMDTPVTVVVFVVDEVFVIPSALADTSVVLGVLVLVVLGIKLVKGVGRPNRSIASRKLFVACSINR